MPGISRSPWARAGGSAAHSLAAYSLGITDLDPLAYGLFFERFLNPERMSPPDIDVDFCYERRGEIIDYVSRTYGWQNVAQITTFGSLKTRQVIRDVGRALEVPYPEVDRIAKLVPERLNITLEAALQMEPRPSGSCGTPTPRSGKSWPSPRSWRACPGTPPPMPRRWSSPTAP